MAKKSLETLTGGLKLYNIPELESQTGLLECNGWIPYRGLLRKDWGLHNTTKVLSSVTTTAVANTTPCESLWLTGFNTRYKITISAGNITSDVANIPILLTLDATSGITNKDVTGIFTALGANSLKIAVTTEDKLTQCYVEIERWNNAVNQAWLWVRVPEISATGETTLYLYYDATASNNSTYVSVSQSVPAETVWDSNYKMVMHLENSPVGLMPDSTNNDTNGTSVGSMTAGDLVNSYISRGIDFDGINDAIGFGNAFSSQTLTIEAIVKFDNVVPTDVGFGIVTKSYTGHDWFFTIGTDSKLKLGAYNTTPTQILNVSGTTALTTGVYYHLTAIIAGNGNTGYIYVNGVEDGSAIQTGTIRNTNAIYIGAFGNNNDPDRFFDGIMDEVRVSNIARSVSYVKATHLSNTDTLLTYVELQSK